MTRKFILIGLGLILSYILLISLKLWYHAHKNTKFNVQKTEQADEIAQRVYSFSFSKYTETGDKELQIEGDSADIFAENVALINVIAKAYAEDSPVTITADQGSLDRKTSDIVLHKNVVATTENGARLLSDHLHVRPKEKRMETDSQTKVKKDNINVEGTGAISDSQLSRVTFKKNVTVVVQDPESEEKSPTVITSDGPLEVDYKRNAAHFTKNVVAQHAQGTLKADYMDVYYEKNSRRVGKIVARGNVEITSKEGDKTYSDNAVYMAKEGRMILGGDVEVESDNVSNRKKSQFF